jgi:hypothetical protein
VGLARCPAGLGLQGGAGGEPAGPQSAWLAVCNLLQALPVPGRCGVAGMAARDALAGWAAEQWAAESAAGAAPPPPYAPPDAAGAARAPPCWLAFEARPGGACSPPLAPRPPPLMRGRRSGCRGITAPR